MDWGPEKTIEEVRINLPERETTDLDMSLFRSFMDPNANSPSQERILMTFPTGDLYSDCDKSHETAGAGQLGQIKQKMAPVLCEGRTKMMTMQKHHAILHIL